MAKFHNPVFWTRWLFAVALLFALPLAARAVVAQAYKFAGTPVAGSLVSVDPTDSATAVLANTATDGKLIGVVVPISDPALQPGTNHALVGSSGTAQVLVSNINGAIKKGDYITASAADGIGEKATQTAVMLGVAQADFTGQEAGDTTATVTTGHSQRQISIGQIPVGLEIGTVALDTNGAAAYVPVAVQRLADLIAGHSVSALRLILAGVILLVGLISTAAILYSAINSSIQSIGRNPLSSGSVYRGLFQVGLITIAILAVCLSAMYGVIRL